uniref:THAP-type domain-containing protein n=1 Tax=Anopheles culicifacies TaxID=139723 RepID=A0A182MLR5_9DIPT
MGGCRCTFRECENGTATRKELHYFRYPVRNPERLKIWIRNAKRSEFLDLPTDKLCNKVVCQEHFERQMFMNELRDRLTHLAIPRLMPTPDGNVLNVETNTESDNRPSNNQTLEPVKPSSEQTKIKLEEIQMLPTVQVSTTAEPPHKKIKILNLESMNRNKATPCEVIRIKTPKPKRTERLLQLLNKRVHPIHHNALPIKAKATIISDENGEPTLVNEDNLDVYIQEDEVQSSDEPGEPSCYTSNSTTVNDTTPPTPTPVTVPVLDPALSEKMDQTVHQLAELKKLVQDLSNRPDPQTMIVPAAVQTKVVMEKGPQLTKAQLFNSIKRYLNPTMVTLLRMELFAGSSERQWKTDEKSLAVDMINLGEQVYDHFKEEFRFRLPSKSDAKEWQESGEIDADDAC